MDGQSINELVDELNAKKEECEILRNEIGRLTEKISNREKDYELHSIETTKSISKLLHEITVLKKGLTQEPIVMADENKNDTAIFIITYNTARFIKKQVELIRRLHKYPVDIIIVDNSFDPEVVDAIKYYNNTELKCEYLKTDASSRNGSDSHSYAANLSYLKYRNEYKYIMYLDHDAFPIKEFNIKEMLGDNIMAGVGQRKGDIEYFWPGLVMWNNDVIDRNLIDFSTNHDLQIDTGGMLYKVIQHYGKDKTVFINEQHVQNPDFNKSMYNFYAEIGGGTFMHFINGSSWNQVDGHDERISSLLNILDEKTKL